MSAAAPGLVGDELDLIRRLLPPAGARVADIGCGAAPLSRRLLEGGLARSVAALEVDRAQHAKNLAAPAIPGLEFILAGADAIPLPEASVDVALMLKSLHHVSAGRMDAALAETARVLVPGGWLYVSEPVYGGEFNEVVRLFHDEGAVRAAAYRAIKKAEATGVLKHVGEHVFDTPLAFRDYEDFVDRMVRVTHSDIRLPDAIAGRVRERFNRSLTADGARFVRQMRINVLQKA